MVVATCEGKWSTSELPGLSARAVQGGRLYAIAFGMDIDTLRRTYGDPYNNASADIRRVLQRHGFSWQKGASTLATNASMQLPAYWQR